MNERIRSILTLLTKKPETKMAELTKELALTRRQINYAINQFNEELADQKILPIERNHAGDFRLPKEVIQLTVDLADGEKTTGVPTDNERAALLLVFLITNTDYVSVNHLVDFLEIGKTTVAEDLKKAEWLVEKYHLAIEYDRLNGYQLKGHEHRILQLLSDLVKRYPVFAREDMKESLTPGISKEMVLHLIHNMEQMLHQSYSDESLDYLQVAVPLFLERGLKKAGVEQKFFRGKVNGTPEYRMLGLLLAENAWQLGEGYLEWLTLLFLTSNISQKKTTQEFDSDIQLKALITEMVDNFERQTLITIDDRENFERRILSHLRPACFRIQYELSLGVYSLDSLIEDSNHAILIDLMKELIEPTENWLGKAFPNDELDLLSYYFGFQLSNQHTVKKQKPRAVVVCTNGVMVSKLIRENLEKLFQEIHFLTSFSVRDFYQFEVDYDLVFSTIPLKTELPQFVVNPIMTYKEQINLRYRVLSELGFNEVDQSLEQLVAIIQKHGTIQNMKDLKDELQYFLLQEKQDSPLENFKVLPPLTYYLKPAYITVAKEEMTWEEALTLACRPLIDDQVVSEAFLEDCIRQIKEPEYAGYLGRETSIPHTTVDKGVLRDGISLLISSKPIVFPDGREISFIFPLSFYDLTRHLKAVNQIADISADQELLQALKKEREIKSIYQMIRKYT